ncbi:MAG TPA: SMC-Scp complex subunit ScpB [Dissulfurispiraceae bacterium]|nr:SMC-Scp complex subunit ScpB [Dissulfurispiraceae bacterium]
MEKTPDEKEHLGQSDHSHDITDERAQRKRILEALLFVSDKPLPADTISKAAEMKHPEIKELFEDLRSEYSARNSAIMVVEIAGGYQMVTDPDLAPWVRRLKNINQASKLSQASLETLAIVAYKQPITKIEIDQLRGVNSEGALRGLLDKRLIKILGKKDVPGRPFLYGTSREFLQYFGLNSLVELPPIADLMKDEAA